MPAPDSECALATTAMRTANMASITSLATQAFLADVAEAEAAKGAVAVVEEEKDQIKEIAIFSFSVLQVTWADRAKTKTTIPFCEN